MSSLSMTSSRQTSNRFSVNWIVNRRADLLWFIGGAFTGYAMFYLHAGMQLDMVTVWFLWVVFLDTPHFFGTYLRTYFDKEEFAARRKLLIGSLGWLLVGPLTIATAYSLHQANVDNYRFPFTLFIIFFNLWAYWHVVRQHFGIMSLYKRKNNDFYPMDTRIDKALLYGGLLAPFVAFIFRHPQARKALGFSEEMVPFPALPGKDFLTLLTSMFSPDYLSRLHWEHYLITLSIFTFTSVSILFVSRQIYRWYAGLSINLPKVLFMLALIPLYAFICYSEAVLTAPLLAFAVFVTIYHDIQYHAIVWFYSRNRYHRPGVDNSRYGLAAKISKNFLTYAACGLGMAITFRWFGCAFEIHPGCGPLVITSSQNLFGSFTSRELLYSMLIGLPLHHYFVDQFIWRPGRDKKLQQDLKITQS